MNDWNQIDKTEQKTAPGETRGLVYRWMRAVGFFRGFLIVSLIPVTTGAFAAAAGGGHSLNWGLMLAALCGAWCYHAGANLLNDYFDHLSGADDINEVRTPFSGGTRVIQESLLPAKSLRTAACVAYGLGSAVIWLLGRHVGPGIYILAIIGAVSGISYSTRPIWLAYRGLGEIVLGFNFGPVLCAYGAYAQTGAVPLSAWWAGTALGLWSAAIITVNEIPDFVADKASGKMNLVARRGTAAGVRVWAGLLYAAIIVIVAGVLVGVIPSLGLAAAGFLPLVYLKSRRAQNWLEDLDRVIDRCRTTIVSQAILWILLLIAFIRGA